MDRSFSGGLLSSKLQAHMRSRTVQFGKVDWFPDGPTKWSASAASAIANLISLSPVAGVRGAWRFILLAKSAMQ